MAQNQADSSYPAGEATPFELPDPVEKPTRSLDQYLARREAKRLERIRDRQYRQSQLSTPALADSTSRSNPRPRSSVYSQPSVVESYAPRGYYNGRPIPPPPPIPALAPQPSIVEPSAPRGYYNGRPIPPPPPVPILPSPPPIPRLTSGALRSLEQTFAIPDGRFERDNHQYFGDFNPWQHQMDGDDAHSPTDTSARPYAPTRRISVDAYLSAEKRTPISGYMHDRTWLPSSPSPQIPGTFPANDDGTVIATERRRSSVTSLSEIARSVVRRKSVSSPQRSGSQYRRDSDGYKRKSILTARPERSRSSATTPPRLQAEAQSSSRGEHPVTQPIQPAEPSSIFRRPSLSKAFSSLSSFRRRKSTSTPAQTEPVANSPTTAIPSHHDPATPTIGLPYENTRIGPAPTKIKTVRELGQSGRDAPVSGSDGIHPISAAMNRRVLSSQHHSRGQSDPSTPVSKILTPVKNINTNTTTTPSLPPHSYSHFHPQTPSQPSHNPPLTTPQPPINTIQTIHLQIGTLRGPTPAGLRSLHATMERAIARYGEVEGRRRGCKEVRRWLRYEERGVIEWVVGYVRGVWGVEV